MQSKALHTSPTCNEISLYCRISVECTRRDGILGIVEEQILLHGWVVQVPLHPLGLFATAVAELKGLGRVVVEMGQNSREVHVLAAVLFLGLPLHFHS